MATKAKSAAKPRLGPKKLIELYRSMLRIRRVEETLTEVFSAGEIPGFLHVCLGQEAAPAAVCSQLKVADYVGTTHRGHGHALAKGVDLKRFMAELLGRSDGFCLGRSGSMHLADASRGVLGANGIVGAGIPIAAGAALAAAKKYPGRVAVAFFGDGATSQGAFYETLNMASLWKLPLILVCENNGWAEFTPQQVHMPGEDVVDKAAPFGVATASVPNDVLQIYQAAGQALKRARAGGGPTLLEVKCDRWHGHYVGDAQKYRGSEAVETAMAEDCLASFEAQLKKDKVLTKAQANKIDKQIQAEIAEALEFARSSPPPQAEALMEGLYV